MRPHWKNCALKDDTEIAAIDKMEDEITPVSDNISKIRGLISTFELCHHKAEQWAMNIIQAIGEGKTTKGLGTRQHGEPHPAEREWQNVVGILQAWCAGSKSSSEFLSGIGKRSPLKEWQVGRVIDKIRSLIHFPWSVEDPSSQYVWLLLDSREYDCSYLKKCPDYYKEHEDFWLKTVKTIIKDPEELTLGLAIDLLFPCSYRFSENLKIVLDAIGGNLKPAKPFAACARNIGLTPIRGRMNIVSNTLNSFINDTRSAKNIDKDLLKILGNATKENKWLAASLDKTIRLQRDPSEDMKKVTAISLPDWIKEE
jgi:hypothetical protein